MSAPGVSLEPAYERSVWPSDCDVVERVEAARERRDRAPRTPMVCRDADTPLIGNRDVPRRDDTVATAGGAQVIVRISHDTDPRFEAERWALDAARHAPWNSGTRATRPGEDALDGMKVDQRGNHLRHRPGRS